MAGIPYYNYYHYMEMTTSNLVMYLFQSFKHILMEMITPPA